MDLAGTIAVVLVIAFLMVLSSLPGVIAKKKGESFYYWWLASTLTGVIPGLAASFMHRKWQTPPVKAFLLAVVGLLVLGWVLTGIAYLFIYNSN